MDGYRRYYLTISQPDWEKANSILEAYYYRGDIENVTCTMDVALCTVMVGLECSTDDLLELQKELQENGIMFK